MKTSLTLTSLLAVGLCFAGVNAAQAQVKVGVVDMNKVFGGYYKTKDAENKINDARDEINALNKEVDNPALSASAKTDRQKKRDEKIQQTRQLEQEINEFKTSREKQLQEQAVRMRNQIVEEIMTIINSKVKNDNYDLVFDKSGQSVNGVAVVLHSKDSMEFSDDVITALNKSRPAATAPAATPKK